MADLNQKQATKKFTLPKRPQKRLFIGMLLLTTTLMAAVFYGVWYIARPGLAGIADFLPGLLGAVFVLITLVALLGIGNMILAVNGLPRLPFLQRQNYELINMLFPLAVRIAKIFGISRRRLEGSFIATSNLMFNNMGIKVPADKLLVVTPHCLQLATCPHKITRDPHNCKRCGGCDIGALVTLADELGFTFFVATGGTLARQVV
ncbi:MAG: DUF116 domain-containing protein, partial [Selenomonas sp.]|nr:DUF116 domain-containing protein [Selenomonas sp.]